MGWEFLMFWHGEIGFRPIEEKDLERLRAVRNDMTTWINLTDIRHISQDKQIDWFLSIKGREDKQYHVIFKQIFKQENSIEGEFLGFIRMDEIDRLNRSIRVGCDIAPEHRGKGFGTKTYAAILKYCFDYLNMHRVWLCVLDFNDVGIHLYSRAGFKLEGKYRDAIFRDGKYHDYLVMSILEDEYRGKT
jgi:RimJ/RimL family protein N-acetyltransferase